jgi:nitric oxide reductase subunit C
MTKATTRRFFWGGTVLFTAVFVALTVQTHTTIGRRTHAEALTPAVSRGLAVWGRYNCENCHTLLGEGAYFAPDLTKIVQQRGSGYLAQFLHDPSRFYSEERDRRLMPTLGLSEAEIADVIEFLGWVGNIDTNGWPPRPILVAGVAVRGLPGVSGTEQTSDPVTRGKALFNGAGACAGCHSIAPGLTLVGPSLDGVDGRASERTASADYRGAAHDADGYLRESILEPSAYVVPGNPIFAGPNGQSLMPPDYGQRLDPEQIDDLVAYLTTLR